MGLSHSYAPRGSCIELFKSREAEILLSGPAGTGKSRACLEKLHAMCLINPGMRALIVRKTAASLTSTALVTWREHVVKEALQGQVLTYYGGSSEEAPQYRYSNGSTVAIGGMDKATRVMSSEYDLIYVQEATELSINDWEALTTRLRNGKVSFQQLIADTNPDVPTHWLKQRCEKGTTKFVHATHEDNPILFDSEGSLTAAGSSYIGRLDNLTGVRYLRLRKGLWVAAEGLIYEEFVPEKHIVERFDIPVGWARYWVIDFGYTNPTVVQNWAEDPDGKLYLYREIYTTRQVVADIAKEMLNQVTDDKGNWTEPKPTYIVCDHDAENRDQFSRVVGLGTHNADKRVQQGIQAVQVRFKENRLFILRDSVVKRDQALIDSKKPTCTAEEVVGYIWDVGTGKAPKEQPLKIDDHGMDCIRYLVMKLDQGPRTRLRWM